MSRHSSLKSPNERPAEAVRDTVRYRLMAYRKQEQELLKMQSDRPPYWKESELEDWIQYTRDTIKTYERILYDY